jgi:hypothetical protein
MDVGSLSPVSEDTIFTRAIRRIRSWGSAVAFQYSRFVTTVPLGATTGTAQVVRPAGTLSSSVRFRVR